MRHSRSAIASVVMPLVRGIGHFWWTRAGLEPATKLDNPHSGHPGWRSPIFLLICVTPFAVSIAGRGKQDHCERTYLRVGLGDPIRQLGLLLAKLLRLSAQKMCHFNDLAVGSRELLGRSLFNCHGFQSATHIHRLSAFRQFLRITVFAILGFLVPLALRFHSGLRRYTVKHQLDQDHPIRFYWLLWPVATIPAWCVKRSLDWLPVDWLSHCCSRTFQLRYRASQLRIHNQIGSGDDPEASDLSYIRYLAGERA